MKSFLCIVLMALVPAAMAAEPKVIDIKLDSYTIKPDHITLKVNEPVTFKISNEATFIPHDLVIKAPDAGIDIKVDLKAGKSGEVSFTPTKAGTYEMVCDKAPPFGKSHKEKGMHGVLTVEP